MPTLGIDSRVRDWPPLAVHDGAAIVACAPRQKARDEDERADELASVRMRSNEPKDQLPRARCACHAAYAPDGRHSKRERQACSRSLHRLVRRFWPLQVHGVGVCLGMPKLGGEGMKTMAGISEDWRTENERCACQTVNT